MKVVILAGGYGTRLAEYTSDIPKPLVKIGNEPILTHIMRFFSSFGFNSFIIAAGYKQKVIFDYYKDSIRLQKEFPNLKIVNTGKDTMTGGRILKLKHYFNENENFFMTYGDGLSDVDLNKLKKFHDSHGKIATVTAVHPPVRFGELEITNDRVTNFEEKPQAKAGWINGGFFILNYKVFDYIKDDTTMFEKQPMTKLANQGKLMAFKHNGFWKCMDTLRDKIILDKMWNEKKALWKK
tara:strand:- start:256 stop:969 length:714 start_codon:yes stop_codon:yes gene_type:complete